MIAFQISRREATVYLFCAADDSRRFWASLPSLLNRGAFENEPSRRDEELMLVPIPGARSRPANMKGPLGTKDRVSFLLLACPRETLEIVG
jgi:hypothetical protein